MSCVSSPVPSLFEFLNELFQLAAKIINILLQALLDTEHPLIMNDSAFRDACLSAVQERYVILKTLSSGADGETFLAIKESRLEECRGPQEARKYVRVIKVPRQERAAKNLRDEISCLKALEYEGSLRTVQCLDCSRSTYPYAATEWVRGPTLHNFLEDWHDIPAAFVWSILADLLEASLEMRDSGRSSFIHRDLHGGNVMLDFYDLSDDWIPSVKIIDFSRAVSEHADELDYYASRYSDLRAIGALLGHLGRSCSDPGECNLTDRKFWKILDVLTEADFFCRKVTTVHKLLHYAQKRKRRALRNSSYRGWTHFTDKYKQSRLLGNRDIQQAFNELRRDRRR